MTPIVIVGAGRSGTNMLRNAITAVPGITTFPCDEINYLWRYGNRAHPNDELKRDQVSPKIANFIRYQFEKLSNSSGCETIVEKTCANSVRLPFVDEIFPEARYIFIIRDGRDVVASAIKRWKASLNFKYIYAKSKYIPKADIPFYFTNYLKNRLFKLISKDQRLRSWGPKYSGMQYDLETKSLTEVACLQWKHCVKLSLSYLKLCKNEKYMTIRYEDMVRQPELILSKLDQFMGIKCSDELFVKRYSSVNSSSVGKWKTELTEEESKMITLNCRELLLQFQYI